MKARTFFSLLSLGTNVYLLSKDKALREKIAGFVPADKVDGVSEKIEEIIAKAYEKLCIAHTKEIARLQDEIDKLKAELESSRSPAVE